jgi:NAD(P)-dependent dehydrogenase (short-subunit alcohol dehydrogenase family)
VGELDGVVAVVTGAASGIGREHALLLAHEGASLVVNDLVDPAPVVEEIRAGGGTAVGHRGDVADWVEAEALVAAAVEAFGGLHALVNNAGGGGQALAADVTEEAWDHEIRLNLKGMFCPTRAAIAWWQAERAAGRDVQASIVSTTSGAGLLGNVGQAPYGAAKAGVAALTMILAAELAGTGVHVNAVAPAARTPATRTTGGVLGTMMGEPSDPTAFDAWHPRNIAPLVGFLCTPGHGITGRVFHVRGGVVALFNGWTIGESVEAEHTWTITELRGIVAPLVERGPDVRDAGGEPYRRLREAWNAANSGPTE